MAAMLLGSRLGLLSRHSVKPANGQSANSRRLRPIVSAFQPQDNGRRCKDEERRDSHTASAAVWQRALKSAMAGICTWAVTLPALAFDAPDTNIVGPSADDLLGAGPDFSFTTLLLFTLLGYWLVKSITYISQNTPDGPDQGTPDNKQQRPGSDLNDIGHAHIRSYVDSSHPGPGADTDARHLRNASLARSATYRVNAAVKESQPRIHTMVEEMAAPQAQWPLRRPRNADVDFVSALVYSRMMQERSAKGAEYVLGPRERAVLETRLLEEVAEKVAAEQVAEFIRMAAKGTLHPPGPGNNGADQHPHSHAH